MRGERGYSIGVRKNILRNYIFVLLVSRPDPKIRVGAYKAPSRKTAIREIFLLVAICRFLITGIGNERITTSSVMSKAAITCWKSLRLMVYSERSSCGGVVQNDDTPLDENINP